jgi:hypothetical protein
VLVSPRTVEGAQVCFARHAGDDSRPESEQARVVYLDSLGHRNEKVPFLVGGMSGAGAEQYSSVPRF